MIRYTFITSHYHYLRFVCLFLFLCLFAFLFAVFNAGVMSHQHLEPKRLGSALAAIRDTNVIYVSIPTTGLFERDTRRNGVRQFQKHRFRHCRGKSRRANVAIFKGHGPAGAQSPADPPHHPARTTKISEHIYISIYTKSKNRTN